MYEKLLQGLNKYGSTIIDQLKKKSMPTVLKRIFAGLRSQTVKERKKCKFLV